MSDEIKLEDLPKTITGSMTRSNRVILCDRCHGFGFIETEELSDYHKREYTTSRTPCKKCEGDGRLIETVQRMSLNHGVESVNRNPYVTAKEYTDPHGYTDRWVRYRIDHTDLRLEDKYPELKAVNYDNYDKLVEYYRTIETLKK